VLRTKISSLIEQLQKTLQTKTAEINELQVGTCAGFDVGCTVQVLTWFCVDRKSLVHPLEAFQIKVAVKIALKPRGRPKVFWLGNSSRK
jgi:hypothetical protein